ncbi:MAG: hypothetical protein AAF661_15050 [Pseudomonadota bacterium]
MLPFRPFLGGAAAGGVQNVYSGPIGEQVGGGTTKTATGVPCGDPFPGRVLVAMVGFWHTGSKRSIYTIQFDDGNGDGYRDGFIHDRAVNNEDATGGIGAIVSETGTTVDLRITVESGVSGWTYQILSFSGLQDAVAEEIDDVPTTGVPSLTINKYAGQLHLLNHTARIGNGAPATFTNFAGPLAEFSNTRIYSGYSWEIPEVDENGVVVSSTDEGQNALIYARLA